MAGVGVERLEELPLGRTEVEAMHTEILTKQTRSEGTMSGKTVEVTDNNFQAEVDEAKGLVLVDFWA